MGKIKERTEFTDKIGKLCDGAHKDAVDLMAFKNHILFLFDKRTDKNCTIAKFSPDLMKIEENRKRLLRKSLEEK